MANRAWRARHPLLNVHFTGKGDFPFGALRRREIDVMESEKAIGSPMRWSAISLFGSLTALGPIGLDMYLPSVPEIAIDLGASPAQTQTTFAAFLFGMSAGQLIYGPLSDRMGRKPPMVLGVGVFICGSVAARSR